MAERSAIQIFRIIAPEFKDVPDTEVEAMLELCDPGEPKRRFGRVYNQALALLAAHRLKPVRERSGYDRWRPRYFRGRRRLWACQRVGGEHQRVLQHGEHEPE